MKPLLAFGLIAGLALLTALVLHFGAGSIGHALGALGWGGFALVVAFHMGLIALMGLAWWLLARGRRDARIWRFAWGRLIRDSGSEALPLSQVGGYVLGARAITLSGLAGLFAVASTLVDVTVELIAQIVYTLLGLGLLGHLRPGTRLIAPILAAVTVMALLASLFVVVQARGIGPLEQFGARIARRWSNRAAAAPGELQQAIRAIHDRRRPLAVAFLTHLVAWVLNGVEAWVTLRLMGVTIGLAPALVVDSLLYGIRSAAFVVPNAIGVQEGGYILLGGLFGIPPGTALALSLIRRGRDLAIGAPALAVWQALEGSRVWRSATARL